MRKVLSIVLALAMVLGCFASVFAAEFTDVKTTDDFATAVSVLSDLGVVSGYTDGTYKPEKVVTRAEMASLIVKALGLTPAASSTTNFSDVPASHWASGYIAYANSLGIIAGYTDGTFKPSKTVSYDEAVTMLVQALGYTADSLEGTTWPTAFIMKAQTLDITKGVELLGSAGANRGDIAELVYNTLTADIGKTNKDGDFVKNGTEAKPDNMLTRLGVATDTDAVITGEESASIDLAEYVGAYVTPYKKDGKIVAVEVLSTKLEGAYKKASGKDTFAGTEMKVTTVASGVGKTFLNGKAEDGQDYTKASEMQVKLVDGKIDTIYSFSVWKSEKPFMATKTSYDAKNCELGGFKFTKKDDAIKSGSYKLVGADSLEAIAEDSVVSVYLGGTAKEITKVEVGTKTVTGKVTAKTDEKVTVAGTTYDSTDCDFVAPAAKWDFENEFVLYFDYDGTLQFAAFVGEEVSDEAYAVVLAANYETSGDGWSDSTATVTKQVKLLLTTGEEVTYDVYGDGTTKKATTLELNFDGKTTGTYPSKKFADDMARKIVAFKLKDGKLDTVVEVVAPKKVSATSFDKINKNSTLDGKYFADSAVAFVWDSTEGEYTVVTADKLAGMALKDAYYVTNDKGQIAVMYSGATEAKAADVYGIYTGEWTETKDGVIVSFYVDGAPVKYTAVEAGKPSINAGEFSTITFDGEKVKVVTAVPTGTTSAAIVTTGGSLTGNTYKEKATDGKAVGLDAKVVVYIWDGKALTVGTIDDLTNTKNTGIKAYDLGTTKDQIFDVVVITR